MVRNIEGESPAKITRPRIDLPDNLTVRGGSIEDQP